MADATDPTRTVYRVRVGNLPDNESLTCAVRLTVTRIVVDARDDVVGRPVKVRDPLTISGWSMQGAIRKAQRRGVRIVHEDQRARGVSETATIQQRS